MGFPVIKSKSGALVIVYTREAGGIQPIHGAYLSRSSDANVWMPCSWTEDGYRISKNRPTDLDIVEEIPKLKEKSNAEAAQQVEEGSL